MAGCYALAGIRQMPLYRRGQEGSVGYWAGIVSIKERGKGTWDLSPSNSRRPFDGLGFF